MSCGHSCATCVYWDRYETEYSAGNQNKGDCRRQPPLLNSTILAAMNMGDLDDIDDRFVSSVYLASTFPVTHASSWCGEHGVRDEVPLC